MARQKLFPGTAEFNPLTHLRNEEVAEPKIAGESGWIRVKPVLSGICGSDAALVLGKSSPYLSPLTAFPAVLGHEVVARIAEGTARWTKETLVSVDPSLAVSASDGSGALLMGFHRDYPGGFGEDMWVPENQVIAVPPLMPPSRAVLAEPLSIVLHGLTRLDWPRIHSVLVIGAGTIGLLNLLALHEQHAEVEVWSIARYPHQQQWGKRLGATAAGSTEDSRIQQVTGPPARSFWHAPAWRPGGFDAVIDAAGTAGSLQDAMNCVAIGGQILLIGGAGSVRADMTPLWSRSVSLLGSFGYGEDSVRTFSTALEILNETEVPVEDMVTHTYSARDYAAAFHTVWNKHEGAIKVCLNDFGDMGSKA